MNHVLCSAVAALFLALSPSVHADAPIKAGSTIAGQPASGMNAQTKAWEGVSVELMQAIAADMKQEVQFQPFPFGELQPALNDGRIDVIAASYGITPERANLVDFTNPYGSYRDVIVVQSSLSKQITSLDDLKGMRIATSRGSSYVAPLERAGAHLVLVSKPGDSFEQLAAGTADGILDNGLQLRYIIRNGKFGDLRIIDSYTPVAVGKLAFAVRKGNATLLDSLNASSASWSTPAW